MKPAYIIPGALCICLALLLSGCVSQELSEYERFACIDLSSKAYAFVPECNSQEECFSKASSALFDFDASVFSSNAQEQLFFLKNSLAQSWLYFNKTRKNLSEINKICSERKNIALLALQVNEANNNLLNAFAYSDKASQFAFSVLLLEEADLESGKIELIKEEPLFNDFIAFNNNLNDLQSKNSNSGSFAGYYLKQMHFLQALMQKTGFSRNFIDEATPMDFFEKYDQSLIKQTEAKRLLEIPFVAPVLDSFISFLNNFLKINSASQALEKMPAFEFLSAYSTLAGTENSAMQKFSALLKSSAMHRKELLERNNALEKEIESKISFASKKIDALSEKPFASFDANFFAGLYSLLGQDSKIATQKFSIQDFSNFREKALAEFLPRQFEFFELRQKAFLGSIALGERALALKQLNSELDFLLENLAFLESESITGLDVLCTERLQKISVFLKETDLPDSFVLKASDLKARIQFSIKEFSTEKEQGKRLLLCKNSIEEFNDFRLALKDFESYSLEKELFLDSCFDFLSKIFASKTISLDDFELRLQKIMAVDEPYASIENLSRLCLELKQDTLDFLGNSPEIVSLEKDFLSAKELLQKLRLIDSYSEKAVSDSLLADLKSGIEKIQKYFSGNKLVFSEALPVLPELQKNISSLKESLESELDNAIAKFVSESAVIESVGLPCLGQDINSHITIKLNNPFRAAGKVLLKIPFEKQPNQEFFSVPKEISFSTGLLLIDLNSLPLGLSFFEFYSHSTIATENKPVSEQFFILRQNVSDEIAKANASIAALQELGISTNSFAKAVSDANALLSEAQVLFDSGKAEKALEKLLSAGTALQKQDFASAIKKISGQKNNEIEKAAFYWKQLDSLNEAEPFLQEHNLLLSLDSEIEHSLALNDFNQANFLVNSLKEKNDSFVLEAKNFLSEKTQALLSRIDSFSQLASKGIPSKISALLALSTSVPEETLNKLGYIAPISNDRLKKLELQLEAINTPALKEKLNSFKEMVSKNSFSEAIEKYSGFEQELSQKEIQLNAINAELDSALASIKEDAAAAFDSAANEVNNSAFNPEAIDLLEKAESALAKEQFLKSIAFANAATGLLSAPSSGFDIPIFFYPILIGIALVFIVRYKKNQILEKKAELKKILRNRLE